MYDIENKVGQDFLDIQYGEIFYLYEYKSLIFQWKQNKLGQDFLDIQYAGIFYLDEY